VVQAVRAHSYVNSFIVEGVHYAGFHPPNHNTVPGTNPDVLAAWSTEVSDDGWVGERDYEGPDIICHLGARSANGNAPVRAGDSITFKWNGWPESHHGPVVTHMAYCGEEPNACLRADMMGLEFFGIDAVG